MERNLFTPIISKSQKIAFLKLIPIKSPRHGFNFNSLKNIGIAMIYDVLINNGYNIQFTDNENADKYDIIFISLTSVQDIIAVARQCNNNKWRRRKFKVIAGGFGMQNYIPIQEYIDFAFFGRVENDIINLIENNFEIEHKSLIKIGTHKKVFINQSDKIYENIFLTSQGYYKEKMYGCPNKCYFCHYSFSRKYINTTNNLYSLNQGYKSSIEIEQCKKELYTDRSIPNISTSIDGYSERLRYSMNKRISNNQIIEFFEYLSNTTKCRGVIVNLYNIVGYETENENDYNEFLNTINKIKKLKKHVAIKIASTPLNPSICTPMAYAPIDLNKNYTKFQTGLGRKGANVVIVKNLISVHHGYYLESQSALLENTIPIRTTNKNIEIFNILAFDKKYNNLTPLQKVEYLTKFNGFESIYREYSINEELPTQYVNSFIGYDKLKKMRTNMRNSLYNS